MRVLKEALIAISQGASVALPELGLPVIGSEGLLIVFWKGQ